MSGALRPILVLKAGTTLPAARERHGDFERWFVDAIGSSADRFLVVDVPQGGRLGAPADYAAAIVTGSSSSMTAPEPWFGDAIDFLRRAVEVDLPTLGVCFGHQMLAVALGGRVEKNPNGREIGTVQVELTDAGAADPLFAGLPRVVTVQATHTDAVTELPAGAVLLASNERCPVQAFAVGRRVRTVQWHPEFTTSVIRGYIEGRKEILESEGFDPEALWVRASDTDSGPRILRNFDERFVGPPEGR
jgi:GMP synthase (glutamine-hydrolysing)